MKTSRCWIILQSLLWGAVLLPGVKSVHSKETEIQSSGESSAAADDDDTLQFQHFVAHNRTMTCSADEHARPFNNQIRGVNLGGWMVLEPVSTRSLEVLYCSPVP